MPWLANRNPRANSLDKLSIGGHSGLLLRAPRGYSASSRWSQVLNLNKAAQTNGTWAHYPMLREVHTYGKSFREKNFTARPINAGGKVSNLSSIQEPRCNLRGQGNF